MALALDYARFSSEQTTADLEILLSRGPRHIEDSLIMLSARDHGATLVSDDLDTPKWAAMVTGLQVVSSTEFRRLVTDVRSDSG